MFGILLGEDISWTFVSPGETLTIVAQMSEAISPSSSNTVTIGSVDVVMSVDADDPSVMTGTYVVPSGLENFHTLSVSSVSNGTVQDDAGNLMNSETANSVLASLAAQFVKVYEVPADSIKPTIESFVAIDESGATLTSQRLNEGDQFILVATMSEALSLNSANTVKIGSTDIAMSVSTADPTLMLGTYTVPLGVTESALDVVSYTVGTVKDEAGNSLTADALPIGVNSLANSALSVDTEAPFTESFSVENSSNEEINSVFVSENAVLTIVAQMSEAISSDATNIVTIGSIDVPMSVSTDDPSIMTGTLTVPAGLDEGLVLSTSNITAGTVQDENGNAMTSTSIPTGVNALSNSAVVVDYAPPTLQSFSVLNSQGELVSSTTVGAGTNLIILAQMSEVIAAGSTNFITIGAVDVPMSVDTNDSTVMAGSYIVPGDLIDASTLDVVSITVGTVEDNAGKSMVSTAVPTGENALSGSSIVVDYSAPTLDSFTARNADGDTISSGLAWHGKYDNCCSDERNIGDIYECCDDWRCGSSDER